MVQWVWFLVRDLDDERTHKLRVADTEGVGGGLSPGGVAPLRTVGPRSWLQRGILERREEVIFNEDSF